MRKPTRYTQEANGDRLIPYWVQAEMKAMACARIHRPKRYTLLIREAMKRSGLRWWEQITTWNPYHKPIYKGIPCDGGLQSIDFLVYAKGTPHRTLAILVRNPSSVRSKIERDRWAAKQKVLEHLNIPVLILEITMSSQEYQLMILNTIRKLKGSKS
jgi:hypothetical protein